jgi:predicted ribosome quality control (RQC) complex YloA/Tae2 family protein
MEKTEEMEKKIKKLEEELKIAKLEKRIEELEEKIRKEKCKCRKVYPWFETYPYYYKEWTDPYRTNNITMTYSNK